MSRIDEAKEDEEENEDEDQEEEEEGERKEEQKLLPTLGLLCLLSPPLTKLH